MANDCHSLSIHPFDYCAQLSQFMVTSTKFIKYRVRSAVFGAVAFNNCYQLIAFHCCSSFQCIRRQDDDNRKCIACIPFKQFNYFPYEVLTYSDKVIDYYRYLLMFLLALID